MHVLEGKTQTEIAAGAGLHVSRVNQILKTDAAQRYAEELQAEHAARIRGKVRALADRAAAVIQSHLADGAEVADYVRSADAKFVLEKVGFPADEAPLVEITVNPRSEFETWLSALPPAVTRESTAVRSAVPAPHLNGNGNGSSSSHGA